MNFKCKKEDIEKAVLKADKITGKNFSLPVLQCVFIETKKGGVVIKSTNLDLGLEVHIPAKIIKKGSTTIPSNLLYNFISNLNKNENVEIKEEKGNIEIISNKNRATIKTFKKEDFPSIPKIKENKKSKIKTKKLVNSLKSVWFSASTSNIKPELSSVYIRSEAGKIYFVSTDSFRLSEKSTPGNVEGEFEGILIPQKNITEIIRSFDDIDEEIVIFFDENQIAFKSKNIYLLSRIIDGTFPDYNQIIPKEFISEAIVLKQDVISALKISNVFTDQLNQTRFKINKKNNTFEIETQNKEYGFGKSTLKAEITGESLEINFNHKYVQDCFNSINSESIKFSLAGPGKPMLIQGTGDSSYRYIVMPMNK